MMFPAKSFAEGKIYTDEDPASSARQHLAAEMLHPSSWIL